MVKKGIKSVYVVIEWPHIQFLQGQWQSICIKAALSKNELELEQTRVFFFSIGNNCKAVIQLDKRSVFQYISTVDILQHTRYTQI